MFEPRISLRDHLYELREADHRLLRERREADATLAKALREADQKAVDAALAAAKEKALAHNDLIGLMRQKESSYVTKSSLYLALIGVVGFVTAAMAVLGYF